MKGALNIKVKLLVQEIREAFADVPYPGDENISASRYDEGMSGYFSGTSQEGHAARDLRRHASALSFFTSEAFHYYLPAFAIAVLQEPEDADIIYDHLIYDFHASSSTRERLELFNAAQREAMVQYFEYCLHDNIECYNRKIACAITLLKKEATL